MAAPRGPSDESVLVRQLHLNQFRERVTAGLSGDVVEIGFGSGFNVPYYPAGVTRVVAIDPDELSWSFAAQRVAASSVPIEQSGLDGQRLPFPDDTFDSALSTWTLCSIPDADAALKELQRVLKPGGRFHFVEHGLHPDPKTRRSQRRIEPIYRRVTGGCHLTRQMRDLIAGSGFEFVEVDEFVDPQVPKIAGSTTLGVATTS